MGCELLPRGLRKAIERLEAEPARRWRVGELAALCGVAPRTLQKHFQRFLGRAPLIFLRELRFDRARQALLCSAQDASITDIATHCGFAHLGRFAIHTTRKRLLSIPKVRPFVVQNLGKYERQLWAGAEFGQSNGGKAAERQRAYIEFVLKLTQAIPLHGYAWLHGVKAGCMVHVGAVDAPVSVGDVAQIAAEFRRAVGTGKDAPKTNGVDVLGWDFAFELNEVARQQAAAANIQMRFLRIPRDVMDKRAVEQGDIHFFELAALSVEVITNRRNVALKLKDFVIPPDDVPEEARRAVKHWSQWIDYWAVDWDNRGDTFHNEWQTYRTRKDKSLALEITHTYPDPGEYAIVAKVIDILGNVIQLRP